VNRFILPLSIFGLLVVVLAIGIKRAPEKSVIASPLIGKPAPVFELPNLADTNSVFKSSSLQGRWYVLNVWGTWCAECRIEHPVLLDVQRSGVVPIIGLNWRDDDGAAVNWLAQLGTPYETVAADREGRVAIDWGAYGAPETFLVNPQGIVVHKHVGPLTQEIWEKEFQSLLPKQSRETS
jgi:cytochrome c biogenesis protein CcmG, thiol:disulfide interchange protein DsbE